MKPRYKIYLAIVVAEVLLGVVLNSVITGDVPPTSPATAEDFRQFRQSLADSSKP